MIKYLLNNSNNIPLCKDKKGETICLGDKLHGYTYYYGQKEYKIGKVLVQEYEDGEMYGTDYHFGFVLKLENNKGFITLPDCINYRFTKVKDGNNE